MVNLVKKEMKVPEKETMSIKIGNSQKDDAQFVGKLGGFDIINGSLTKMKYAIIQIIVSLKMLNVNLQQKEMK